MHPMRHPMLKPALRRTWRDRHTAQFGVDPRHARVVEGLDEQAAQVLALLDGSRGLEQVHREAAAAGTARHRVDRLLEVLRHGGVLDDAAAAASLQGLPPDERERLRPDLSSLSVVHAAPGAAPARLAARHRAAVVVHGAGRVGSGVAAVLAAAGVGRVDVVDTGRAELWDASPCGTAVADRGRPRTAAARTAAGRTRRASTGRNRAGPGGVGPDRAGPGEAGPDGPAPGGWGGSEAGPGAAGPGAAGWDEVGRGEVGRPATRLLVLAPRDPLPAYSPAPRESRALLAAGVPHLYAGVLEGTGFVGPLVVPGAACGECLTLRRVAADPAWPRLLAQLRSGRAGPVPACDTALAVAVAGLAALHGLMLLDGGVPSSVGARVEVSLLDTSMEVRPVAPHPDCPCGAAEWAGSASAGQVAAAGGEAQVTMEAG
jgi:bacteriocin biosynthesis cyclodehydratase domain-containing protein